MPFTVAVWELPRLTGSGIRDGLTGRGVRIPGTRTRIVWRVWRRVLGIEVWKKLKRKDQEEVLSSIREF
jgi:hypothetical protein